VARKERTGNLKTRRQCKKVRVHELRYYLIVTNTEATERCYFNGLHDNLPKEIKEKVVIRVVETKTRDMIYKCLEMTAYEAQYRIPWIVFDRDQVKDFDEIIQEANEKGIEVGWSNPCFEIWLYAYFGSMSTLRESWSCCMGFGNLFEKKTGQKYLKADNELYNKMYKNGNEEKAINIAKQKYIQFLKNGITKPSKMCPCTTLNGLIGEIKKHIANSKEKI